MNDFDDFLEEEGLLEKAEALAVKRVLAQVIENEYTIKLYLDEDEDWFAYFVELPEISAFGDSPEEALQELKTAWTLTKDSYI